MIRFLIRTFKVLTWGVGGLVLALLLAFAWYDVAEFQSRGSEISKVLERAHPNEREPPAAFRRLLLADHGGDLSLTTARILLFELEIPCAWYRGMKWHLHSSLWWLLVRLHLSEDEQIAIVSSRAFLGRRAYGYEAAAWRYFGRPLPRLSEKELASLVVISRWPNRYARPDFVGDLFRARDALMKRASVHSPAD